MKTASIAHGGRAAASRPATPSGHRLAELVGAATAVLDVGCLDAALAQALRDRGCRLQGLALRPVSDAAPYERVVVTEADQIQRALEDFEGPFDAIVSAGALERLRVPEPVLEAVRRRLAPAGRFVTSVFNVAHASVRDALAQGRFPYADDGPLARDHVRFFTEESLVTLLEQTGFAVVTLERALDPPTDADAPAASDRSAATVAFRVRACPLPTEGMALVQQRMRTVALEAEAARERLAEAEAKIASLREQVQAQAEEIGNLVRNEETFARRERELRTRLLEAHDQLLQRDEELYAQQRHEATLVARAHGAEELLKQVRELDEELQMRRRQVEERDHLIREQELRLLGLRRFTPGFVRRVTASWFRRGA